MEAIQSDFQVFGEKLDFIDVRLDKIDVRFDGIDGRLDKIEASLEDIKSEIADLKMRLLSKADLDKLQNLEERVKRLEIALAQKRRENMTLYTHKDSNIRKTWMFFALFYVDYPFRVGDIGLLRRSDDSLRRRRFQRSDERFELLVFRQDRFGDDPRRTSGEKNAPELYNIVENLAITAGLPMPKVYLVREKSPNAFATGKVPNAPSSR